MAGGEGVRPFILLTGEWSPFIPAIQPHTINNHCRNCRHVKPTPTIDARHTTIIGRHTHSTAYRPYSIRSSANPPVC